MTNLSDRPTITVWEEDGSVFVQKNNDVPIDAGSTTDILKMVSRAYEYGRIGAISDIKSSLMSWMHEQKH